MVHPIGFEQMTFAMSKQRACRCAKDAYIVLVMPDNPPEIGIDLVAENQTLRARVAQLEAEIRSRDDAAAAKLRAQRKLSQLDPAAPDRFQRPYDGR